MEHIDINAFRMIFGFKKDFSSLGYNPLRLTGNFDLEVLSTFSMFFKPKLFVEIGVFRGETSKFILDNSPWIEKYTGVDMLPEKLPGYYFREFDHCRNMITGEKLNPTNCPGVSALEDVRFSMLYLDKTDGLKSDMIYPADMVFIDGDHSYDGVKRDTINARASLRDGEGVLIWHDFPDAIDVVRFIGEYSLSKEHRVCHIQGTSVCFEIVRK